MSLTNQQVSDGAMQLTSQERFDMAEKSTISVNSPEAIAAAWDAEIERRSAQLDAGEVETYPFDEVIAELRAKLQ